MDEMSDAAAERAARRARLSETLAQLRELFPKTFVAWEAQRRPPIAIGSYAAILARAPAIDPIRLKDTLRHYCGGLPYLRAIAESAPRLDLDGAPVGPPTDEQIAEAKARIKALMAKFKAQREAKRRQSTTVTPPAVETAPPAPSPPPTPLEGKTRPRRPIIHLGWKRPAAAPVSG